MGTGLERIVVVVNSGIYLCIPFAVAFLVAVFPAGLQGGRRRLGRWADAPPVCEDRSAT